MKELDPGDFRARRFVLEPDDFALGSEEPDPPPSDLIDEATWRSLTSLPDDVSIRTSNHYGTAIKVFSSYCDEWSCLVGAIQEGLKDPERSPIARVTCDAGDEFQASIFNALTGFYRVAFSTLRNVVEHMTVGVQLELANENELFQAWLKGERELKFGWAADLVPKHKRVAALEDFCKVSAGDDLFSQKNDHSDGGFARRLFSELCKFTHGAPGFKDADMRQSNGPIFVPKAFQEWALMFQRTYALALASAKIARPRLRNLAYGSKLTPIGLFNNIVGTMPVESSEQKLLSAIRTALWEKSGPA